MSAQSPTTRRGSDIAGNFLFTLDQNEGSPAWIKSVQGGDVKAALISDAVNVDYPAVKHLGLIEVEPITAELAFGVTSPVLEWVQGSWNRKFSRRNGSIVHASFSNEILFEQQFQDALVVETTFPTLDAGDRSPAYLTIKIQPEMVKLTEERKGSKVLGEHKDNAPKRWCPANFRMDLSSMKGENVDCSGVKKIESFSIKQHIAKLCTGANRWPQIEPTRIEFPDLVVTLNLSRADDFRRWHEGFVIGGKNGPDDEKQGVIELLDPGCSGTLLHVELERVGIKNLSIDKSEANETSLKTCRVELYVESMKLRTPK